MGFPNLKLGSGKGPKCVFLPRGRAGLGLCGFLDKYLLQNYQVFTPWAATEGLLDTVGSLPPKGEALGHKIRQSMWWVPLPAPSSIFAEVLLLMGHLSPSPSSSL